MAMEAAINRREPVGTELETICYEAEEGRRLRELDERSISYRRISQPDKRR